MRLLGNTREQILLALCLVLLGFLFLGGRSLPEVAARETGDPKLYEELKVFTDVLALIERDYVSDVDSKKMVEGAIKGMLSTLDPHSGYLDPDFYKDLQVQTKGEFGGLGIEIAIKDGLLIVVSPMEGSPAEKAGIKTGDQIIKIEGKFTREFSLVDAVKKLRGPKGSAIEISIHREGVKDLLTFKLVRDRITVTSVRGRHLGEGFGYVRLSQFVEHTADELKAAIEKIRSEAPSHQIRGLILDMRNNPGGLLTQAIRVGDMFLKDGVIVYTDGRVETQKQKFFAHEQGTEPDYPIIVVVNGGSASAAEIVAGALKDHGRGLILGTQTFGKGSVQTITPLENGGALTLTTALYYTKSGQSLQGFGVHPDIEMEGSTPEEDEEKLKNAVREPIKPVREADLPGAITNPSGIKEETPMKKINKTPTIDPNAERFNPETANIADWLKRDRLVARALDLLKSYDIFKGNAGAGPKELKDQKMTASAVVPVPAAN